jgi:sugar transferase (PEP-CTERM system associated)
LRSVYLPTSPLHLLAWVLAETCIISGSFVFAVVVRLGAQDAFKYPHLFPKALLSAVAIQLCFYYDDLYEEFATPSRAELAFRLIRAFVVGTLVLTLLYWGVPALRVGRGILFLHLPVALFGVLLWRHLCLLAWGQRGLCENVLILGTGQTAQQIAREMLDKAPLGYRIVGFLGEHPEEVGRKLVNPSVVGTLDDLPTVIKSGQVTFVVVALEDLRGKLPVAQLLQCRLDGAKVEDVTTFFERLTGKILVRNLRPSWFVFSEGFNKPRLFRRTKRVLEFAVASLALVLLAPLLALLAVLIKLESQGPVFYRQQRVGEKGRNFMLIKLRTMRVDAEAETGPVWARGDGDPRMTRMGRFLRALRLDELPQFLNVVRGEMSFVGPRPERPHFVEKLQAVIPYYGERHSVKPGITGWAQIKFGYGSNIEDAEEKLQFDLFYIKHMSWVFDIGIVFQTLKVMALGRGAR